MVRLIHNMKIGDQIKMKERKLKSDGYFIPDPSEDVSIWTVNEVYPNIVFCTKRLRSGYLAKRCFTYGDLICMRHEHQAPHLEALRIYD